MTAPLLDAKGAAELLSVPASWVLAEARADRIPHVQPRPLRPITDADELLVHGRTTRQRGPGESLSNNKRPGDADDAAGHGP